MKIVKNFGGGVTPKKLKLKNRENAFFRTGMKKHIFAKKNFWGWKSPLTPKFGDPLIFRLFVDI